MYNRRKATEWDKHRIRITNLIKRSKVNIDKSCVLCGKPGLTYYNPDKPNDITFICPNCRKKIMSDKEKYKNELQKLEDSRYNILDYVKNAKQEKQIKYRRVDDYMDEEVTKLVEGFPTSNMSLVDYAQANNLTRYMFLKLVQKYNDNHPKHKIDVNLYKRYSNRIQN